MDSKLLFFVVLIIGSIAGVKKDYTGYKVFKVTPNNKDEVVILNNIEKEGIGKFWTEPYIIKQEFKVMVSEDKQNDFVDRMKKAKIEVVEVIKDLQSVLDNQLKPATAHEGETFPLLSWDRYHNLDEIYAWMDELVRTYPNIVKGVSMGRSVENRDVKGIIINYNENNKYVGVLEGTLHAREWISPAVVTWIANEFLISSDPEIRTLAESFEWHIFPVVNPDGYVYTFTDNRMWRKNRNPKYNTTCAGNVDNDMSNGVDLNRNFDFKWMTVGASDNPCTNTFAGSEPASEIETQNIVQYVRSLNEQKEIIYYIAFHSYSQLIVVPYSHVEGTDVLEANNFGDMFEIGVRGAQKAKERFGTEYKVGVAADVLYPMSGTSFDWVKYETDVPVSYLIELRDLGDYGFLLPPEQIVPNSLEIMDFILEMDRTTKKLGYYSNDAMSVLHSIILISSAVILATFS